MARRHISSDDFNSGLTHSFSPSPETPSPSPSSSRQVLSLSGSPSSFSSSPSLSAHPPLSPSVFLIRLSAPRRSPPHLFFSNQLLNIPHSFTPQSGRNVRRDPSDSFHLCLSVHFIIFTFISHRFLILIDISPPYLHHHCGLPADLPCLRSLLYPHHYVLRQNG